MPSWFISRLNPKSFSLAISAVLIFAGIVMIFMGITDSGTIQLSFSEGKGEVQSGLVGVSLIFLGTFISLFALAVKPPMHSISIKHDNIEISWQGHVYSVEQAVKAVEEFGLRATGKSE